MLSPSATNRRQGWPASDRTPPVVDVRARVAETIEIRRSREEIWAFVADHANDPAWCKKVRSVEAVGPQQWRVLHNPVPLRPEATLMVEHLELDPPWGLKLREEDDASVFEVEYRLEAISTGTRFTQTSDFEWKTLPRVLHKAFARGVQRDVRNQLRKLKGRLTMPPQRP